LFTEQGWLRLLIPVSVGGLEYDLPDLLALQEAASWADGSFGWVLALCGGAGFFAGFVDEGVARTLFGRPDVCAAGTGFPAGTAEEAPGGYRVSGHWRYASGAPHATLYTANCQVMRDGESTIRAVIFLPDQVVLRDGWQSLGLRATSSQDMIVRETFVPAERTFSLDHPRAHAAGALYHYPFLQQAEAVLSVTLLGMTRHFLDLFEERILPKFPAADRWAAAAQTLEQARVSFYTAVSASWASPEDPALLLAVGDVARRAVAAALHCTDELYPYGGMEMMRMGSEINRVWRDIHTASQHTLLSPL
jgi:alkylation response protein AidB-like acyl-CoA dehydrogenase